VEVNAMPAELTLSTADVSDLLDWATVEIQGGHLEHEVYNVTGRHRQQQQQQHEQRERADEAWARLTEEERSRQSRAREKHQVRNDFVEAGLVFLSRWFAEVKLIICTERKLNDVAVTSGVTAEAITASMAASLMSALAITNTVAVVLATTTITIIGTAGLKAFCTMDKEKAVSSASTAFGAARQEDNV
jgi:hypothetical protein